MKQSAPLAQESSGFEISLVGFLAHALGKMTGGMIVDKILDLGNTDITLMVMQAIYQDAGDKRLVAGSSSCLNGGNCVLFDDGSIDYLAVSTDGANVVADGHKASDDELKDSEAYLLANSMISQVVNLSLEQEGKFEGDDYISRTAIDAGSAIRNRFGGTVRTVIRKAGLPSAGYVSEVDGIADGMTINEAAALVKTRVMTPEEMEAERKIFMDTMGTQNIFNSPVGQA